MKREGKLFELMSTPKKCREVIQWDEEGEVALSRCQELATTELDRHGDTIDFCKAHAIERGIIPGPQLTLPGIRHPFAKP